ncbi:MAG: hypothetical protein AVDCRST_MAG42-1487 [uncultured Chthoniobacterales bacterium]|uniref:Uncharacterized protein n=1 Tax=uncultured Chthoniobacterales bacterium TaxID=1836801 RepID=A0A6J4I1D8_9BACT|nr:MAG: hypothetical protein AVDCRST_MAG42-1487 [uncultured Chthoniobacterales bacterium]
MTAGFRDASVLRRDGSVSGGAVRSHAPLAATLRALYGNGSTDMAAFEQIFARFTR